MQVKQRVRINTGVTALSVVAVLAVIFLTAHRIGRVMEQNRIADALITAQFERLAFRTDYLRTGSERAREQVRDRYRQVDALLKSASETFADPEDEKTIGSLIRGQESIGKIFRTIVANRNITDKQGRPAALVGEIEGRLLSQLDMRVYEAVLLGERLQDSSNAALFSALKQAGGEILLIFILVSATTLFNSWTMGKAISERVGRLRQGAAMIGGGNLDHMIDIRGNDEFAELSGAFNAMTAKLQDSYRELQKEIDERKRAEDVLRESRQRNEFLANIISASSQPFGVGYPDGRLGLINPAFEQLTGYNWNELRSIDWAATLTPPEWREVESLMLEELLQTRKPVRYEKEYIRKDGSRIPIELLVNLVTDEEGKPEYFYSFVSDITERKRAEEALQNAHDKLAKLVEERTRELNEKEVLLKEIHHRVKNNLQVISSLVGLQADGSNDETVREVLKDVTHRVRSMALVHEKLYQSTDLSRIDFAEYVRSLLGYLWSAHGSAAAAIRLTLDLESLSLPVDTAVPCGLILNELAGNALKHAFQGRSDGEVTVTLKGCADGRVSLGVCDNGVGLPAGLDWRQSSSLGLRLVQLLTGQLGAGVEVLSGEGTRFKINFSLTG